MISFRVFALLVIVAQQPSWVSAYDIGNHYDMSRAAFDKSVLSSPGMLERFGLKSLAAAQEFSTISVPGALESNDGCAIGRSYSIRELFGCGAQFEDAGTRALNHFFDPQHDGAPLMVGLSPVGLPSPDWALNDNNAQVIQDYSYKKARDSYFEALTTPGEQSVRDASWGKVFQTLGQVVHHLQDMAQPQHVRNDAHCDNPACGLLYKPSRFEAYTGKDARTDVREQFTRAEAAPIYPAYQTIFKQPRLFWATGTGEGIAEFTSTNFVSAGTNFSMASGVAQANNLYAWPTPGVAASVTVVDLFGAQMPDGVATACANDYQNCFLTFHSSNVTDRLTGQTLTNDRASVYSIFNQDLEGDPHSTLKRFSLNRFTYDAVYPFLIPRAVGYSAGLINYFFRGDIQISLPDEGVYGIIDHNVPANSNPVSGGFPKIKMKVRNLTSAGNDASGNPLIEAMSGSGTLIAVAKFHTNTCYLADLSGEYGSPAKDWTTCRSEVEEIAVSNALTAPAGINDAPQPVTFTFPSKIPISATDLHLQVIYRGQLGEESDAVVVATKDISEPRYIYNYARWDQYTYSAWPSVQLGPYSWGDWCLQGGYSLLDCNEASGQTAKAEYGATAAPIPGYDPANAIVPPGTWTDIAQEPPLLPVAIMPAPVGTLARIAVLTEANPTNTALWVLEWGDASRGSRLFMWNEGVAAATRNQLDPVTNTLVPSVTYLPGRGVYLPAEENYLLTDGNAPNIPSLNLTPSQINF